MFRTLLLMAGLLLGGVWPMQAAETLVSIDAHNRLLNTQAAGALKVYRVGEPVEVRVNGVQGQLDQLRPGMQLVLGFANPQSVNRIQATDPAQAPLGAAMAVRRLHLKLKVDGSDLIKVRDGKLWIEHKSWSKPSEIYVNAHSWKPNWDGDKSDEFTTFSPALAPFGVGVVEVKKLKGRGSATLKQKPGPENNDTLVVEVNDGTESGAAPYEVAVTW